MAKKKAKALEQFLADDEQLRRALFDYEQQQRDDETRGDVAAEHGVIAAAMQKIEETVANLKARDADYGWRRNKAEAYIQKAFGGNATSARNTLNKWEKADPSIATGHRDTKRYDPLEIIKLCDLAQK